MHAIIALIVGLFFIAGLVIFLYKKMMEGKNDIGEEDDDDDFLDFTKE